MENSKIFKNIVTSLYTNTSTYQEPKFQSNSW